VKVKIPDRPTMPGAHGEEPPGWDRDFERVAHREFKFVHRPESIASYVSSWSLVANMPADERERFLGEIRAWAPEGPVELPFRATATVGRPRAG